MHVVNIHLSSMEDGGCIIRVHGAQRAPVRIQGAPTVEGSYIGPPLTAKMGS